MDSNPSESPPTSVGALNAIPRNRRRSYVEWPRSTLWPQCRDVCPNEFPGTFSTALSRNIWELSALSRRTSSMSINANKNVVTLALGIGFAVPFLYFGIQIAAAPFFPKYSFLARDASTLGSNGSNLPALFNIGSLIVGIATFIASWGFFRSFRLLGVRTVIAWLATLALVASGLADVNAYLFPLPDPRHTDSLLAVAGAGTFLLPFLLPLALRKLLDRGLISGYFVTNIVALIALIPITSGLIQRFSIMAGFDMPWYQAFLNNYQGLLQRLAAVIVFGPIAVSARYLVQLLRTTHPQADLGPR